MGFKEKNITEMNVGSIVGEKTVIDGNFTTSESTRVDGEIKGDVTCKNRLFIGTKGKVKGNITTDGIMVSGEVVGDIISSGKVEISSTGKVTGDIQSKILVIDENAVFNGSCNMNMSGASKMETIKKDTIDKVKVIAQENAS